MFWYLSIRLNGLVAVSGKNFRISDLSFSYKLFIKDTSPLFNTSNENTLAHVWRSSNPSVSCTTNYNNLLSNNMTIVTTKSVNCCSLCFGVHTCGVSSGWILWHAADAFNQSGQHPCSYGVGGYPTSSNLSELWVR